MNKIKVIFLVLISSSLMLGNIFISYPKIKPRETNSQFSRIEKPLGLKFLVTLGGLGLIGAEIWWFLFSKMKPQKNNFTKRKS